MTDKVLCPWCGAEMSVCVDENDLFDYNGWTACTNDKCTAEGPMVTGFDSEEEAIEAAKAAARRHYIPPAKRPSRPVPLKPMTSDEILGKEVELEIRFNYKTKRVIAPYHLGETMEVLWEDSFITGEDRRYLSKSLYGKTWRCWERKPTDEERSAAEWEK
jgi:hypothetical protein